jgi:hypothetical protein
MLDLVHWASFRGRNSKIAVELAQIHGASISTLVFAPLSSCLVVIVVFLLTIDWPVDLVCIIGGG